MDGRTEIREFLTTRRAKITPDQVGLPVYGANRRVPGLRREEVAMLAGVSADYYTRLERGNAHGVSDSVLDALARALRLDEAERSHLFDLARAAQPAAATRKPRPTKQRIRPAVQRILDAMTHAPAFIRNGRLDILAANQLGYALYSTYLTPGRPANTARFVFLDPRSEDFYGLLGPRRRTRSSRSSAPKPAVTRTTASSRTSSASSPPKAKSFAPNGPPTTSASTTPVPSDSTIRSSASSSSPTKRWSSPLTPA